MRFKMASVISRSCRTVRGITINECVGTKVHNTRGVLYYTSHTSRGRVTRTWCMKGAIQAGKVHKFYICLKVSTKSKRPDKPKCRMENENAGGKYRNTHNAYTSPWS